MSDDAPAEKRCTKCGEVKPLEGFGKAKHGKYGRRSECNDCRKIYNQINAESIRAYAQEWRAANAERLKAYFQARYAANPQFYSERHRAYQQANAEKLKAHKRQYRIANADHIRQKRIANAEKHRQVMKIWHAKNSEQQQEYRKSYYSTDRQRERRAANPDQYRAIGHRYRARKKANGGSFTAQQIHDIRATQNGICAYCGQQHDPQALTIDHIIPVSQGGSNDISNICLACPTCNCSKKDRTPEQWVNRWYLRKQTPTEE